MFDGFDKVPIENMNFKQLREQVQQLRDLYEVLIRRYPELSVTGGDSRETEIDWANIVTELIRASANKIILKAIPPYSDMPELEDGSKEPPRGADKSQIYKGTAPDEFGAMRTVYWYWNGNEWKQTFNKNIYSYYEQTPAGFYFQGVIEAQTDTGGRLTISDSFIKMYPEDSDDPKLQLGYDGENKDSPPVILLGVGSGADETTGMYKTRNVGGWDVRFGQAILTKDATEGVIFGMVSEKGTVRMLKLVGAEDSQETEPGLYYIQQTYQTGDSGDEPQEPTKIRLDTLGARMDDLEGRVKRLEGA